MIRIEVADLYQVDLQLRPPFAGALHEPQHTLVAPVDVALERTPAKQRGKPAGVLMPQLRSFLLAPPRVATLREAFVNAANGLDVRACHRFDSGWLRNPDDLRVLAGRRLL